MKEPQTRRSEQQQVAGAVPRITHYLHNVQRKLIVLLKSELQI